MFSGFFQSKGVQAEQVQKIRKMIEVIVVAEGNIKEEELDTFNKNIYSFGIKTIIPKKELPLNEEWRAKLIALDEEISKPKCDIKEAEKILSRKAPSNEDYLNIENKEAKAAFEEKIKEKEKIIEELNSQKSEIERANEKLKGIESLKNELQKQVEEFELQNNNLQRQIKQKDNELIIKDDELNASKRRCDREKEDLNGEIGELNKKLQILKKNKEEAENQLLNLVSENRKLKNDLSDIIASQDSQGKNSTKMQNEIKELSENNSKLKEDIEIYKGYLNDSEEKRKSLSKELEEVKNELSNSEENINSCKEENIKLQAELEENKKYRRPSAAKGHCFRWP